MRSLTTKQFKSLMEGDTNVSLNEYPHDGVNSFYKDIHTPELFIELSGTVDFDFDSEGNWTVSEIHVEESICLKGDDLELHILDSQINKLKDYLRFEH